MPQPISPRIFLATSASPRATAVSAPIVETQVQAATGPAAAWTLQLPKLAKPEILCKVLPPSLGAADSPGCSVTWLARLHGVQKVAGSNPVTPTW